MKLALKFALLNVFLLATAIPTQGTIHPVIQKNGKLVPLKKAIPDKYCQVSAKFISPSVEMLDPNDLDNNSANNSSQKTVFWNFSSVQLIKRDFLDCPSSGLLKIWISGGIWVDGQFSYPLNYFIPQEHQSVIFKLIRTQGIGGKKPPSVWILADPFEGIEPAPPHENE
jgi:hypothetical protein